MIELLGCVPLLLLGFMLAPKLQLGSPDDEALANRSCVALSMQVAASRDWKHPRSHVLRGNAVPDALRPVFVDCDSRRSALYLHSHAARGNEEKERG